MSVQSATIAVLYTPVSMKTEQYDEIIRRAEEAGAGAPPGRLFHMCYGTENNLRVLDLFDSEAAFQGFAQNLLPILGEVGVEFARPPEVVPVHNMIAAPAGATA